MLRPTLVLGAIMACKCCAVVCAIASCIAEATLIARVVVIVQVTAKQNFTHVIQFDKREEHQLVVHGIYRLALCSSQLALYFWVS